MRTAFSTTFVGADENPLSDGGTWTGLTTVWASDPVNSTTGPCQRLTSRAYGTQPASTTQKHNWSRNNTTVPSDAWGKAVVGHRAAGSNWPGIGLGCVVGGASHDSQYLFEPGAPNFSAFYRIDSTNDVFTVTDITGPAWGTPYTVSDGDSIWILRRGSELRAFRNSGANGATTTAQAAYANGQPTIYIHTDTDILDCYLSSFSCGDFVDAWYATTFAGADETPLFEGGNWMSRNDPLASGAVGVVSNTARSNLVGSVWASVAGITAPANQSAQITIGAWTSGNVGPFVRIQRTGLTPANSGYFYGAYATNSALGGLWRFDAGVFVRLTTTDTSLVSGDTLKITAVGSTLTAYKNGVQIDTASDATYASGDVGVWLDPEVAVDRITLTAFQGGDINGPGGHRRLQLGVGA